MEMIEEVHEQEEMKGSVNIWNRNFGVIRDKA